MFDYFPGYNKFRSVTFAITITIFCLNLLGFLGLEKLIQNGWTKDTQKQLLIAFGLTGGISLLLAIFSGMFSFRGAIDAQLPDWLIAPIQADRKSLLVNDALRSFFFVLLALTTIGAWLKNVLKPGLAVGILTVFILLDMWTVDNRYLNESNFIRNPRRAFFNITDADNEILKDNEKSYRVFNLSNPFNEARTSYYHKSIGGYHGAKLRRYQDVIENCITVEHGVVLNELRNNASRLPTTPVLNMLNTKYFVAGSSSEAVLRNFGANGAAWFIKTINLVDSPDDELGQLCQTDTKTSAIVDQTKFTIEKTNFNNEGSIRLLEYKPNKLIYESSTQEPGFAVFSEIYYPEGWVARIDGQETPIYRANYILRALEIPGGEHSVEFSFEPKVYSYGNMVTTISTILLVLLLIGTILVELEVVSLKKSD